MPKSAYELKPLRMSEFIKEVGKLPSQEYIIDPILPKNEVCIICGEPWTGKSLELQNLACTFGAGGKYHGLSVKKCQSFYLTWEGASRGISNRFSMVDLAQEPEIEPIVKMVSHAMPLNNKKGYDSFRALLDEANLVSKVEVVLFDSFSYTIEGNTREDKTINEWWNQLKQIVTDYNITPIFSWEFSKQLIIDARGGWQAFNLDRLKTASTTAYKVNTVIAIGELKNVVQGTWTSLGHRIVVLKAKDNPAFEPLEVSLSPYLTWEGQHWEYDGKTNIWMAKK